MRRILDGTYRGAGWAAAISLLLIFALVSIQVLARILDSVLRFFDQPPLGFIIPSIAEISGFLLAVASFMALAYTLTVGGHIRVGVMIDRLPSRVRRVVEAVVGIAATALAVYSTLALVQLAWKSWRFNDVSYGFIPIPLWLPQGLMALGLAILSVALVDVTQKAWRAKSFLDSGSEV